MSVHRPQGRQVASVLLVLCCAALAVRTYIRNRDWADGQTLLQSAVATAPNSYKPHLQLAKELMGENGDGLDRSISEGDQALAILDLVRPEQSVALPYANVGSIYRLKGDLVAKRTDKAAAEPYYRKALAILLRGRVVDLAHDRAWRAAVASPGEAPRHSGWDLLYNELGQTYLRIGQPEDALEALYYGRNLNPKPEFFGHIATSYQALKQPSQAAISLMEGLVANPAERAFASELMDLYRDTEPASCAVQGANLNLECPLVHNHLCTALRNVIRMHLDAGRSVEANVAAQSAQSFACPSQ